MVGNDLTSLLAASADDVHTVLKHLGSVSDIKLRFHAPIGLPRSPV